MGEPIWDRLYSCVPVVFVGLIGISINERMKFLDVIVSNVNHRLMVGFGHFLRPWVTSVLRFSTLATIGNHHYDLFL